MAKRRIIGVQFDPEEIKRSTKIQLDPETVKSLFPKKTGKNYYDYIREFLQSEELYEEIWSKTTDLIHSSLTEAEKKNCPCNDPNRAAKIHDNEKSCSTQIAQFQFAYYLSANDYVRTILNHNVIFNDKEALKALTINYFNCFTILPRIVYFDVDKLAKFALDANFKALSKIFEGSEIMTYLKGINRTINELSDKEVENKIFGKEDENFIGLQKEFLENKIRYLNRRLAIAEKEGKVLDTDKALRNSPVRPNRTDLAYLFYYLAQTNTKVTENVFPSILAWKEIGEKFEKSAKNVQKAYNLIVSNPTERLKKRRDSNMEYVIENLLKDYPEALKLAKDELKLAKIHW
tara:strand:+ start:1105 stop:2145 length:1041 start_codon:yes stop_codon:yes gene_type:complete